MNFHNDIWERNQKGYNRDTLYSGSQYELQQDGHGTRAPSQHCNAGQSEVGLENTSSRKKCLRH